MDPDLVRANRFLARLPEATLERVVRYAHIEELRNREAYVSRGDPIDVIRFPLSGMASMVSTDERGDGVEVVTIGREGVAGVQALFRNTTSAFDIMWQLPGSAVVNDIADVRSAMDEHPELLAALADYLASLLAQAGQNGACNRLHGLEQRAAKWLLLTDDRGVGDRLDLTQEFFSEMLGVTRPKLSLVERTFRAAGYIGERSGGAIGVLDRAGLEEIACGCYVFIRDEIASLEAPGPD